MKKDTARFMREMATHSSLGLTVAFSIFIGLFAGVLIDKKFGTNPWGMFIGLGFGIAAAYSNIIKAINKSNKL